MPFRRPPIPPPLHLHHHSLSLGGLPHLVRLSAASYSRWAAPVLAMATLSPSFLPSILSFPFSFLFFFIYFFLSSIFCALSLPPLLSLSLSALSLSHLCSSPSLIQSFSFSSLYLSLTSSLSVSLSLIFLSLPLSASHILSSSLCISRPASHLRV